MVIDALSRVFVGRERELGVLRSALADCVRGRGRTILVSGEAGIGKTRLLREIAAEARGQGFAALFGHCSEAEKSAPLAPIVEIVDAALGRFESREELRAALGEDAPELARVVPRIRRMFPDLPPPFELPPEQQRHVLFNAVRDFLGVVARNRATLMVIEDLHWADEVTLSLAPHLCRHLADSPGTVVLTHRDEDGEASSGLAAALEETLRGGAERFRLRRFSVSVVGDVVRQTLGVEPPRGLVATLHRETDGNPFFLVEVLRSLEEEGRLFDERGRLRADLEIGETEVPRGLRHVVDRRLDRVSESARGMLMVAAAAGREFGARLVARASGLEAAELVERLEDATRAGLITPVSDAAEARYAFSHELIRQALVARLSLPRAQEAHLALATALEQMPGGSEERSIDLARHLEQAGPLVDPARKRGALAGAGERCLEGQAFGEALGHFERALSTVPIEQRRALALRSLKRWEEARRAWDEALEIYERLGDVQADVGQLCALLTEQYLYDSRWADALVAAEKGLAALGERATPERCKMLALSAAAQCAFDYEGGRRKVAEAHSLARTAAERHVALAARGALQGKPVRRRALLRRDSLPHGRGRSPAAALRRAPRRGAERRLGEELQARGRLPLVDAAAAPRRPGRGLDYRRSVHRLSRCARAARR